MTKRIITEAQVRQIAQEEVVLRLLEEGMWDDVKVGAGKLKNLIAKQFGQAASKWGEFITKKLDVFTKLPDDVSLAIQALKSGMKESGESIELDDSLKAAQAFGKITKEQVTALVQEELEGPVHDLAASVQKSTKSESRRLGSIYATLLESPSEAHDNKLNELGVTGAVGVGLAILGGMPMLFAGLKKLAKVLRAEKLAALFEKAEHVTHLFEIKTINAVVPNRLSYAAYKLMHKRGLRFSDEKKEELTFEEYVSDDDESHAMKRVNGLLYKALLIYFAFSGFASVLHAGASLIGVVEGAATTVKGVELARGAMELAALTSKTV